jgi:lysozyme family protein
MTPSSDSEIISWILAKEGGYVNNPSDPGGPTNYGITWKTLSEVRGRIVDPAEVAALTESEARAIYLQHYIIGPGFENVLDVKLRWLLVDCAVNNGRGRAIKWLQAAIGTNPDGFLGPQTIGRLTAVPSPFYKVCASRLRAYAELVRQNHELAQFVPGWINRTSELVES